VRDLTTNTTRLVTFSPALPPFPEIQPTHNGQSTEPTISDDGSTIAFRTVASNIIPNDTNGRADVYTQAFGGGPFRRVSVGTGQAQATGPLEGTMRPQLSANGQIVTWQSTATNLGALAGTHVYVRNTATLVTTLITPGNATEPSISADGRFVAFTSTAALTTGDTNLVADVHVIDLGRSTPPIVRVSGNGNGASDQPSIAPDGSAVVFRTAANNLMRDSNGVTDIVSVNRTTAVFTRLSVASNGTQANGASSNPAAINGGGAAFTTLATNLGGTDTNNATDVYVSTL
jgi:Tol biopolymer transport system component